MGSADSTWSPFRNYLNEMMSAETLFIFLYIGNVIKDMFVVFFCVLKHNQQQPPQYLV